jgi:HEAT repeats
MPVSERNCFNSFLPLFKNPLLSLQKSRYHSLVRKRSRIVFAGLVVAILGIVAWTFLLPSEPSHNGKPFTLWLEEYSKENRSGTLDAEHLQAATALAKMGDKAVPIIIRTLEKHDSPMRNKYREIWPKLPAFIRPLFPKPNYDSQQFSTDDAAQMLLLLGTNILKQIPELLRSRNPAVREAAAENLMWFPMKPRPSTEHFLSLCVPCLKDSDAMVRMYAAVAIGNLGPSASNAVPELIRALQNDQGVAKKNFTFYSRAAAANALRCIGPAAASSLPALTNLLPSADTYLRVQIASAVWHITSNESTALPILISDGSKLDNYLKHSAFEPLEEMGPRAKAALPMLLNELTDSRNSGYNLNLVTNALKSIAPEAAAKAGVR